MKTSLVELAKIVDGTHIGTNVTVETIASTSAESTANTLFVAVAGAKFDGHKFVDDAFLRGAAGALVEHAESLRGRSGIVVQDSHRALSLLASHFAGEPAKAMKIVAMTGTNGKTTINWLVYRALLLLHRSAVRIGTLGIEAQTAEGKKVIELPGVLTTPDPVSLHLRLAQCAAAGIEYCVVEASSHALDQKRVEDIFPDVAVFTNLTRDHLDYHKTMEKYFEAKEHLFSLLAGSSKMTRAAVINIDDEYGRRLLNRYKALCKDFSYGISPDAAFRIVSFERVAVASSELTIRTAGTDVKISTPLIGAYNGSNLTAAFACCIALGFSSEESVKALQGIPAAPGRLERVPANSIAVYVDYAHSPDALERALLAVRAASKQNVHVVFGCGGDRDRGKRPQMGAVALKHADSVIVTSDNPRSEEPEAIINDILQGCPAAATEPDRRKAIHRAIADACAGDTILIAGKGHEDYQIIGDKQFHFSDIEVALQAIALREAA